MTSPPPDTEPRMEDLLALIERTWGYRELRPLQEPAMRAFIEGRDSLVVLPTGGGKSLCYQAPAAYLASLGKGPTVVVSPLIALMKDQVDGLREQGVAAAQIDSSLSAEDRRATFSDLRSGRLSMLFVSPERLVGEGAEAFRDILREAGVSAFAIDEAHCISQWGHDFRPEYRQLAQLKEIFPGVAVHGFTATATRQVRKDIAEQLGLTDHELLVGNFDRPNLTYRVLPRRDMYAQIEEVLGRHKNEAGIIYCMRRKDVDEISATLAESKSLGRSVLGYHAGMTPDQRKRVQEAFIEEECDLIVATIAFGMGIDRSNIRFVLHTAMPKSIEAYQQETGRAGRDGLEAECVLLYSAQDGMTWRWLIEKSAQEAQAATDDDGSGSGGGAQGRIKIDPRFVPAALKHIDEIDRFARGASCRHKALVEYFGQIYQGPPEDSADESRAVKGCGACDMCLGDTTALPDAVIIAQKILSCIARTDQRFGAGHVISVLRGENIESVKKWNHDNLSTFGLLKDYPKTELRDFIYQLMGQGVLAQENLVLGNGQSVPILKLNADSLAVMKGKREVRLVQIVRKSADEARKTRGETLSWEGVDELLFEAMRALRKELATARGVPPYVVFSDATLRELARVRPSTIEKFRLVYGIGERKTTDFGQKFLAVITSHAHARGLDTDIKLKPLPTEPKSAGEKLSATHKEAFEKFRRGLPLETVAKEMNRARTTVSEYLAEYIKQERPASIAPWVSDADYEQVQTAAAQTGADHLKPLFLALNEQIPYETLRFVIAHMQFQKPPAKP